MKLKRLFASTAAIGLLVGSLTACSANAGSASEAKLRDYLSAVDGIARIDLTASNTLPFAGSVSGNVVLDDGISAERAGEILDAVFIGAIRNALQSNDFELNVQQDSDVC